ncbi:MAG: FAD-dependent oxidoreductase [Candidatus Bathyarchaeota archaeon]|nr:FAD-dependent oxidoreductase [Candidatus Bathyarchaeota archaeon]
MKPELVPKAILEKTKYCFECGICTAACPMTELLSHKYNPRSLLQKILTEPKKALTEEKLWLCAWCYRCYKQCPQGLKPPEIFQIIKEEAVKQNRFEGFEKAASVIEAKIPFSTICLHTCFHPDRAGVSDEKIGNVVTNLTSSSTDDADREVITGKREKVAIVGSGPSGLTLAHELVKRGHSITVFEELPAAGGMLRKSMPGFRLPKKDLEKEIRLLEESGVEIRTNTRIGKDIKFDDLWREGYKAVFVAVGAHKSRKLGIDGQNSEGVVDALEFLWNVNTQKEVKIGSNVGVIGGGNVAVDAARTALRHGAQKVTILYRRSREEMPANPWEILEAEKEGIAIEFLALPRRILRKDKSLELECVRVKLGEPDDTGRRIPSPIEGSEFSIQLDTIIVAIGESPETSFLPKKVEVDKGNRILVNPLTMETSMEGVFAGGDAVTGPASVIEAILTGKRAAYTIIHYLNEANIKQ